MRNRFFVVIVAFAASISFHILLRYISLYQPSFTLVSPFLSFSLATLLLRK